MSKPDYKVWVSVYEKTDGGELDTDGPTSLADMECLLEAAELQSKVVDFFRHTLPVIPSSPHRRYRVRCEIERYDPTTDSYEMVNAPSLCFTHGNYQRAVEIAVLVQDMCRHLLKHTKFNNPVRVRKPKGHGYDWKHWLKQA